MTERLYKEQDILKTDLRQRGYKLTTPTDSPVGVVREEDNYGKNKNIRCT